MVNTHTDEKVDQHPEMTAQANLAGLELLSLTTKAQISEWARKWYPKAGYKRLVWLLINAR